MQIVKTLKEDAGKYTCIATNAAGEAQQSIYLHVYGNDFSLAVQYCLLIVSYTHHAMFPISCLILVFCKYPEQVTYVGIRGHRIVLSDGWSLSSINYKKKMPQNVSRASKFKGFSMIQVQANKILRFITFIINVYNLNPNLFPIGHSKLYKHILYIIYVCTLFVKPDNQKVKIPVKT